MHILIIEDDLDLGRALHGALKAHDFSSEWVRRIADAPATFAGSVVDCVLLDMSLPDGTGLALLARWRQRAIPIPVLIITAKSSLDDRLSGLDGGADDYIVKPFAIAELIARIHAVMRRYAHQAGDVWALGTLEIELRRHRARLHGAPLDLSPREFQVLLELARDPNTVVSKGELAQRMEPLGDAIDFGALEVHICNLRRKIGAQRIKTERGIGYMLVP
jgi:two-component system, OmpR family, response regulator QseB